MFIRKEKLHLISNKSHASLKHLFLLTSLLFILIGSKAQEISPESNKKSISYKLDWDETFVLKVKFTEVVHEGLEKCLYPNQLCNLYKISIVDILYYPGATIMDSTTLAGIKFMLVPAKYKDELVTNKEFIITAKPAKNSSYLAFSKLYTQDFTGVTFYHSHMYISGFQNCNMRRDVFEKYIARND